MDTEQPANPLANEGDLVVAPDSQLGTMASMNPATCLRYVEALLRELDAVDANCTIGAAATSLDDVHRQIHALKNVVIATGCRPLLARCRALTANVTAAMDRSTVAAAFKDIEHETRGLIVAYRDDQQGAAG